MSERDKIDLRRAVTRRFRGGGTPYLTSLIRSSEAIRKQFVPTYHEGLAFGNEAPFEEGRENKGIYGLERIYEDRAVLTPYFDCAAYCRYCFKKTRTLAGDGRVMSQADMAEAIAYIRNDSRIDTVLITGGDPLSRPDMIGSLLEALDPIPHVTKIRVGTRHILFQPDQVTDELASMVAGYNRVDPFDLGRSQAVSIGLSINHPDELAPEVVAAVRKFTSRGVTVRGQIVLLKGSNDDTGTMRKLIDRFLLASIVPYYLFHCMDVVGTYHLRTSVQKGLDILAAMAEFSGVSSPTYVYVTPVGKHRVAPVSCLISRRSRASATFARDHRTRPPASTSFPERIACLTFTRSTRTARSSPATSMGTTGRWSHETAVFYVCMEEAACGLYTYRRPHREAAHARASPSSARRGPTHGRFGQPCPGCRSHRSVRGSHARRDRRGRPERWPGL